MRWRILGIRLYCISTDSDIPLLFDVNEGRLEKGRPRMESQHGVTNGLGTVLIRLSTDLHHGLYMVLSVTNCLRRRSS